MKNMLLIYNPNSGKGKGRSRLAAILETLSASGWLVTVHPTTGPGDAADAAARLGGCYERVICCGGDGTLNEVIAGLSQLETPPVLGYIPAGTTNDFSRNLSLPKTPEEVAAVVAAGHPKPCDTGLFNHRSFIYIAAFGAFTDVSYGTPQQFKNLFGRLAYILEGAARLPTLKTYRLKVEHDGIVEEGDFLYGMAGNTVSVGGFPVFSADQVKLDDGLFEVVLVRAPKNPGELQGILRGLTAQRPDESNGALISFQASELTVTCADPLPWTLDGEYGGSPKSARIRNRRQAIQIICGDG